MNKSVWTQSDTQYMIDNYSMLGPKKCAAVLNKTESSIRAKASRLKLYKSITKTHKQFCEDLLNKDIRVKPIQTYINGDTPIDFICDNNHVFNQRPRSVLERLGRCPICVSYGFKEHKQAWLYLVELLVEDEPLFKLGITNNSVKSRMGSDYKRFNGCLLWAISYSLGKDARDTESLLKKQYAEFQYNTGSLISGNTETFTCYIPKPIK